ncbi:MAG: hypothetical protein R6W48_07405 [Gaiellaceae bacterium]
MSAATLIDAAPAASSRLLLDVEELHGRRDEREPVPARLEALLGRELTERLVAALTERHRRRLEKALSPVFADRVAALLAEEHGSEVGADLRISERQP